MTDLEELESLVDIFDEPHGVLARANTRVRRYGHGRRPIPPHDTSRLRAALDADTQED